MDKNVNFRQLNLPLSEADAASLRAGDYVMLTGTLYTGRDAAHKLMCEALSAHFPLPVDLKGQTLYYVGPCFDKSGKVMGAGPTTSMRMDAYAPTLYDFGVRATIGKGDRGDAVYDAVKRCDGVYFCAIGGAGALYAQSVVSWRKVAYKDLGTEAVHEMEVANFPVIVGIDSTGASVFPKR